MTPWERERNSADTGFAWPQLWGWGPFHRHFCSDAIHRDGHPECDQPGTPRRVYVFDPENLSQHERAVALYAIAHPDEFTQEPDG